MAITIYEVMSNNIPPNLTNIILKGLASLPKDTPITDPTMLMFTPNVTSVTVLNSNMSDRMSNFPEVTAFHYIPRYSLPMLILITVILGIMIVSTIIGNVFVIAAIVIERSLQGVSNYLILSLAVTDLMVAVLVMPISLLNQVSVFWYLGEHVCTIWISFDVLCCTASILHLVAISLDRYWAVSNIDYIRRRCARQILLMILVVWVVAIVISVAPVLGWRQEGNDPESKGMCIISQDWAYTIFSTIGAFYFPLMLMLILNYKIYIAARSRIRKKHIRGLTKSVGCPSITNADATTRHNSSGSDVSHDEYTVYNQTCVNNDEETAINGSDTPLPESETNYLSIPSQVFSIQNKPPTNVNTQPQKAVNNNNQNQKNHTKSKDKEKARKAKLEMKRERKAARVLGIITGAFIACWLPFFILALASPFCSVDFFPPELFMVFTWLGYLNSTLNPIIYTIFNPSFRTAFKKLVFGKKYSRRYR